MKEELLYGINPVLEALRSNRRAFELYVAGSITDKRLEKLLKLASEKGIPVRNREKIDIARLCGSEHHQGVVLKVEPFAYAELDDILQICRDSAESGMLLVLDGVQDPHNLGALIRSAACAGAHGVIIPKDRAAGITPAVEKASAGAVETIPVAQVVNIAQTLEELKKARLLDLRRRGCRQSFRLRAGLYRPRGRGNRQRGGRNQTSGPQEV